MRVLFVCTGNTCRSPLAERLARLHYPQAQFESAGVLPADGLHRLSAQVLAEHGADAAGFASRSVFELDLSAYTDIVLIGDTARRLAPDLPSGVRVHHWDVADPFEVTGSEAVQLAAYRACAQELLARIRELLLATSGMP